MDDAWDFQVIPFQSLLHQGISLLNAFPDTQVGRDTFVSIPSSSGHQFTGMIDPRDTRTSGDVSIPSSSGHQFTAAILMIARAGWARSFQSLLHQGISLLGYGPVSKQGGRGKVSIPSSSGHQFTGMPLPTRSRKGISVSIPSSSGHQFTGRRLSGGNNREMKTVSIPSSSGHQFTGRQGPAIPWPPGKYGFNPFFIRASVY